MKSRLLAVIIVLFAVQLACNLPGQGGDGAATPLPAPNQTLTAIFAAATRAATHAALTPTLPQVITATPGGAANPTAAQPQIPTNTRPPATNPTATNTRPPQQQPTNTVPSIRPRGAIVAKYLSTPPTLDGDWSEWKDITTEYPAATVVFGRENWANADDLASSFHIGWDDSNLYIAVKVRDDVYVQNATGADIYKGDGIELLLDTNLREDFYYTQLSPDDFQLGISPGRPDPNGEKSAYLWFPSNIAGARSGVRVASRLETGVYRVEAAIPWNVFEITPAAGQHYGFAISTNDNDDTTANVQQSMVSNVSGRRLTDPTTWGDLHLTR